METVQPVPQIGEGLAPNRIDPARAFPALLDETGILQCLQVLRYCGTRDPHPGREHAWRPRAGAQAFENLAAGRIGEGRESFIVSHD